MNIFHFVLASISLSDTDKKAIIILVIFLLLFFLLLGLVGMAVRYVMHIQANKVDTVMHDVTKTHVVNSSSSFKKLARKKIARIFFKENLIPFAIGLVALLIWVFFNVATSRWQENMFYNFSDLFFDFDWSKVFVKTVFWFHPIPVNWPEVVKYPEAKLDNIVSYIVVLLTIVALIYYAYACQGYVARWFRINSRARSIYEKSLKDYKASEDIKILHQEPLPPTE